MLASTARRVGAVGAKVRGACGRAVAAVALQCVCAVIVLRCGGASGRCRPVAPLFGEIVAVLLLLLPRELAASV